MAAEIAAILKKCSHNITTASTKQRVQICSEVLVPCISREGFSDAAIRAVVKLIFQTIHHYRDNQSRKAVENVVKVLAEKHGIKAVKQFCIVFSSELEKFIKHAAPSTVNSGTCLVLLCWTCILVRRVFTRVEMCEGDEWQELIQAQSTAAFGTLSAGSTVVCNAAKKKLNKTWREIPGITLKYGEAISSLEQSHFLLTLIGLLFSYCAKNKEPEAVLKYKKPFVDLYMRNVLGGKGKPQTHILEVSSSLVCHLTHEDFSEILMPAIQKALLRSPENVLECIRYLVASVSIDLSKYALAICKNVSANLHVKDEGSRQQAAAIIKNLAHQCSDPEAIEALVKHLVAVLNGSDGKLTVWTDRVGVLEGIGSLESNSVSGSSSIQRLSELVVKELKPYLQQEVHEGALLHALQVLSLWCRHFATNVPTELIEAFKKGLTNKTSTTSVRNGYYKCMANAFQGNNLQKAVEILPQLLQAVERASNQSHQVLVVTETLTAALLLARLSVADVTLDSKLTSFWTTLLDAKKQLFVSEKFLAVASEDALQHLLLLVEKLFSTHGQRLRKANIQPWYRALLYLLNHSSWKLRQSSHSCLQRLLTSPLVEPLELQAALLKEFRLVLGDQQKPSVTSQYLMNGDTDHSSSGPVQDVPNYKQISLRVLCNTLHTLVVLPFKNSSANSSQFERLVLDILPDAHHPNIVICDSKLWTRIVRRLKVNMATFVKNHCEDVVELIITNKTDIESAKNILSTVAGIAPKQILPRVIDHVTVNLRKIEYQQVTLEEYIIMQTPEGQLYDMNALESAKAAEAARTHNVKKESKAYSFEEQKWELEFKEEQKKKKKQQAGKSLIIDELSQKEREVYDASLKKESEIRERLQELAKELNQLGSLLETAIASNPRAMSVYIPKILPVVIPLLYSPLAAPISVSLFLALQTTCDFVQDQKHLGELIGYLALRLLKPQCQLNLDWCEENLLVGANRALTIIHDTTVPKHTRGSHVDEHAHSPSARLSAPAFSYCFPFLQCVLRDCGKAVKGDEDIQHLALQVLGEHCKLRSDVVHPGNQDDVDENGPDLLPRKEMLVLLAQIVSTSSATIKGSRLQQLASLGIVELCKSASGEEGCARAQPEELTVLLKGLESPAASLRFAALQGLLALHGVLRAMHGGSELTATLIRRLWVAKFDVEEENATIADSVWDQSGYSIPESMCSALLTDVVHDVEVIREAAAAALSAAVKSHEDLAAAILQELFDLYQAKLKIPPPVVDSLGRVVSDPFMDPYPARTGIAQALRELSPCLTEKEIPPLFAFYVPTGLGDHHAEVRKHMLNAALQAVNEHGKDNIAKLLPVLEGFLDVAQSSSEHDIICQSVIILMGSLAKHFDKDDPKVKPIVTKLINALSTPSQQVQEAVANCLPPLVPAIKAEAPDMVKKLLNQLLESTVYGERKGAAYGLAGLVKGLGILYLKQLNIMSTLQDAIQDKKNYRHREGALFAFEMLCTMLGRLFEPYVVHLLPHLLLCFGDGNQYVREATEDTARAVMKNLSAHGVKLVLPSLLAALEEDSWRTKTGSVELLGAMAYCAPKQLSSCLPSIVPKLTEVLTDSHLKVQKSGAQALKQISSVIKNPEVQAISSVLLDALSDPSTHTAKCLKVLSLTSFVHFIDAPSLALIMPVLHRALDLRSTETKKMSAQIVGNMYALTDKKDLAPYLPSIVPGLKQALLDPVPEVRGLTARALGALVRGMGEESFEDLLPWLMMTLTSEHSSVDRSGAAQGLSEVLCGLGKDRLEKLMPEVVSTTSRPEVAPHVKEGYLLLYIYLPASFGSEFLPFVDRVIPSILKGLADESEFVRDTSLKAGQTIIDMYAETAIALFLPELEKGLFDDNWRIRHSSVQLLGDLLYSISGVTGKMTTEGDEDDNFGTSHSNQAIIDILGMDRRNRVLAGLYMGRSDVALMVRQSALHVWKVVVPNTPRILREILPTLFSLLLGCLASTSFDKRQVAARTLGDLVRKLGERVLPEIIPILEKGLDSNQSDERQGVCIGLSEIISSTSKDQVFQFVDSLVPTVRRALCDPLPEVRLAAAKTFDNLHNTIGSKALDDILPDLLHEMEDSSVSEFALDGLRQVMAVKSRVVLPFLVPQLIAPPVNTRALAILSSVAGEALTRHLTKILPALLAAIKDSMGQETEKQELEGAENLVLSVEDEQGARIILDVLTSVTKDTNPGMRKAAISLLFAFCSKTRADYSQHIPALFRCFLKLMNDSDVDVITVSWEALNAVTKRLDPSEQLQHIGHLRQAVKYVAEEVEGEDLPGFCLPKKGITPILPIFREGILNGTPELKEQAAYGLGEVILLTSAPALRPSVVNITGPLIRILGDRFSANVKRAVLQALGLLLGKVGAMLKPFLPQLQTTFTKALNDPNRMVRLRAASALQKLITLHTRVDPLFTELHNGVKNTEDNTIRETFLQALRGVTFGAGQKMGDAVRKTLTTTLLEMLGHGEDSIRVAAGGCIGALSTVVPEPEFNNLVKEHLIVNDPTVDWTVRHGHAIALSAVLHDSPQRVVALGLHDVVTKAAITHATTDRLPVCSFGVRSLGFLLSQAVKTEQPVDTQVLATHIKVLQSGPSDVRTLACAAVTYIAQSSPGPLDESLLKCIVPALLSACKDKNTAIRSSAEQTLVFVLRAREGDGIIQTCACFLDSGTADSLNDVCRRTLRKLGAQEDSGLPNEMEAPFTMEMG